MSHFTQHLISHLQRNQNANDDVIIAEIRTIDKEPFVKFLDFPSVIPQKHYQLNICDENALELSLETATTVFHCAGKSFEYLHDGKDHSIEYWHDNTDATEALIQVIQRHKNIRLIYVSDAYAFLPVGDNYGLSEQMHLNIPKSFMLGTYGQSKTRAELYVRKAVDKGKLEAIILRPTFIYGEGEKHLIDSALKLCSIYGGILYLQDDNRGHHQFIYAGNMVAIMERAMICLKKNPTQYNGEVVICMDCTKCTRFVDFMEPFLEANGLKRLYKISYAQSYLTTLFYQILSKFVPEKCFGRITLLANKFLNCWSVGFSNRKLRLLLDFVPPYEQSEALSRSIRWYQENGQVRNTLGQAFSRPKMG